MRKVTFILAWLLVASPCQAEATCEPNIPGDISGDCKVDFSDFAIIASGWFMSGESYEWADRYNGPGNGDDSAKAIAIDSNNNVYVTGYSEGVAKDYATIKYSPDSNIPVWVARYNGPSDNSDYAYAVALDSHDNIYVTGYGWIDGQRDDYLTIKYFPESNEPVWVARYNGPANGDDRAEAIAIDSNNNIYVTGYSVDPGGTNRDAVTIKYDTEGNEVWVATYSSGDDYYYYVNAMAIDGGDNIYVTGKLRQGQSYDYFTIKYSGDSNEPVWMVGYNGPGSGNDEARAIATDSNNNIYVTGRSKGTVSDDDYATIKYDTDGNEIWVARYNGPGNDYDSASAIAIDSNDNIYVTGASCASDGPWDYATIKYTPDSNIPVWVARYNGPGDDEDLARAIAIDSDSNIYVTGESVGSGTYYDYATIKYDPNGNEIWVARYNGPGTSRSNAEAIAIDSNNNVYVTGYSEGVAKDYATIRYSPDYTCTPQLDGDLNDDCKVDFFDVAILASNWLECNLDPPSACLG